MRLTVGDSGLCCTCVTYFERELTSFCVDYFSFFDTFFFFFFTDLRQPDLVNGQTIISHYSNGLNRKVELGSLSIELDYCVSFGFRFPRLVVRTL